MDDDEATMTYALTRGEEREALHALGDVILTEIRNCVMRVRLLRAPEIYRESTRREEALLAFSRSMIRYAAQHAIPPQDVGEEQHRANRQKNPVICAFNPEIHLTVNMTLHVFDKVSMPRIFSEYHPVSGIHELISLIDENYPPEVLECAMRILNRYIMVNAGKSTLSAPRCVDDFKKALRSTYSRLTAVPHPENTMETGSTADNASTGTTVGTADDADSGFPMLTVDELCALPYELLDTVMGDDIRAGFEARNPHILVPEN